MKAVHVLHYPLRSKLSKTQWHESTDIKDIAKIREVLAREL